MERYLKGGGFEVTLQLVSRAFRICRICHENNAIPIASHSDALSFVNRKTPPAQTQRSELIEFRRIGRIGRFERIRRIGQLGRVG